MSQRKAALQFNVPRQTLRDRITGKISPDCVTTGRAPVFSLEEEARIVEHVKSMASYGYGYTRQEVTDLATDFAHTIKIKPRSEEFTLRWFEGFIKRWPELRVVKPRSLEILRAKCGSVANVEKYFASLTEVVLKYNLQDKPHLIFNVDEKGITLNHKPPNVVSGIECTTSSVTSGRSSTTTILGCGSASGFAVPPYFVFEGKRLNNELMKGATPGAVGAVSDSGWSNTNIFRQYLTDHFLKYIPGRNNDNVLLLLDGHKSHVAVDIIEWAQEHHIIIHVLPAHTSHILQPLDVGCYGPLQRIYDNECHKTIRKNSSVITKYNICELACKAYQKALCPENLQSAFRKTGIYPLDKTVINQDQLKPSEVFTRNEECKETTETTDEPKTDEIQMQEVELVEVDMNREVTEAVESAVTVTDVVEDMQDHDTDVPHFFAERINKLKKMKSENDKKERKTLGKIVSGMPITESEVAEKVKQHVENQGKNKPSNQSCKKTGKQNKKNTSTSASSLTSGPSHTKLGPSNITNKPGPSHKSPKPGPSRIYIDDSMDFSDTDDEDIPEVELCCVCKQFTPKQIRLGVGVELTKWVQCDNYRCKHWTHLKYCTELRAVRRNTKFYCMHCKDME
ncbi:unnamed protein product [Mytilus edulis]|uniref:DDE-1 domain-containing protein n=1 Tax=Mytilus edulis TaxID=6550 RepID=A0A8S3QKC2_MYTED|nr:unnamed protein product [Mytilus edulis]